MFPYDPQHQTFLNVYEGGALTTQAILDGGHTAFEYFAGTRQGAFAVVQKFVPAGIHHILIGPDHLLFLVGLLLLGGTIRQLARRRHVVHRRAQHHAVARGAQHRQRRRRASSSRRSRSASSTSAPTTCWSATAATCAPGSRSPSASSTASASRTCCARWTCRRARSAGRCSRSTSAWRSASCSSSCVVASALAALRSRSEAAGRRLPFAGSIVVIAAGAFWFVQRVFFPGGIS